MKRFPIIQPLTLVRRRDPFDHPDFVFELKHDGFRGIAYVSGDGCQLVSRNGNVFRHFNFLRESLSNLPVRSAILDGEIVCLDAQGRSQFNDLSFRRGQPYFYAFDLLWLNGRDLRGRPLIQRKESLKRVISETRNFALLFADHIEEHGSNFFRKICEKLLEGIVARHCASLTIPLPVGLKLKIRRIPSRREGMNCSNRDGENKKAKQPRRPGA